MKAIELVKINKKAMEMMSQNDIKQSDYRFVELYDEYVGMRRKGDKYWYIIARLSEKYRVSESSVKRLVRRFSKEVKV